VRSVEKIQAQKSIVENHGRLRGAEYLTDLAHLHLNSGNWMTFNNRIRYFRSGKEKFHAPALAGNTNNRRKRQWHR
jgi:cardiolipin synthase